MDGAPGLADQPGGSGRSAIQPRSPARIVWTKAPRSSALVDGMDVSLFDTVNASYQAFTAGNLDWSRVPPEEVETAAARFSRDGFQPYVAALFFAFNMKSPTFADPR